MLTIRKRVFNYVTRHFGGRVSTPGEEVGNDHLCSKNK